MFLSWQCRAVLLAVALWLVAPACQAEQQAAPPGRAAQRVEQHIADLHRRLRITPAEEPQWNAFAQVMRDNAAHMDQVVAERAQARGLNALEDLRAYAIIAQAHAEDMQRLVPAFQALYEAMPPEQQRNADTVFRDFERRGPRRPPS